MVQPHETVPEGTEGRSFPRVPLDLDHIFPFSDLLPASCILNCIEFLFPPFQWTKGDGQKR